MAACDRTCDRIKLLKGGDMAKTWHVQFDLTVTDNWIDDGFALTPTLLKEVIQEGILDWAYDHEKKVEHVTVVDTSVPKDGEPLPLLHEVTCATITSATAACTCAAGLEI